MTTLPDGVSSSVRNVHQFSRRYKPRRPNTPELLRAAQPTPTPSLASTLYFDAGPPSDLPAGHEQDRTERSQSSLTQYHEVNELQITSSKQSKAESGIYYDAQLEVPRRADQTCSSRSQSSSDPSYETASSTAPTSTAPSFKTCSQSTQDGYFTGTEEAVKEAEKEKPQEIRFEDTVAGCGYPDIEDPVDPARILKPKDLRNQRIFFFSVMLSLNLGFAAIAIFAHEGLFVFVFILFIKSKDFLSVIIAAVGLLVRKIYRYFKPLAPVPQQWILTLIPAYSESEEQIVKTIYSLRDNDVEPHRQVMVVLLDGQPRDVRSHMTKVIREFERPYISLKHKRGVLQIKAGFMEDVPVIVIEKVKNSGKKDSLVLCHDLFNHPRHNLPLYTRLLREELWRDILPVLTAGKDFRNFDMVGASARRVSGQR